MLLSPERPKRAATQCLTTPGTFSGFSSPPPLIVFFRGAVSLSSLSSELSGARLRQLYRRPRERFAVDNRNRLQTFRMAPATISTFSASCISRYILFPRAFPPATTNNTSADVDNKVVGKAIVRLTNRPPRLPCVRGHARLLYDLETMARTTKMTKMPISPWKTSWFCRNLSSSPTSSFYRHSFILHFLSALFAISQPLYHLTIYANTCA